MSIDQKIADFLASATVEPTASKLEPFSELIRQLRQRRWTYQRIAAALRAEFSLGVAPSTIHAFVKVRAKKKSVSALPAPDTLSIKQIEAPVKKPRFNLDA